MSSQPLVTTVIPTFRRPKMLGRAIRSVLAQTYTRFAIRVHDNASGDETSRVVAEIARSDPRVTYHCQPENTGAVANFDTALRRVETPFFSVLSDDDLLLPHFYETALRGFEGCPKAAFSAGATVEIGADGRIAGADVASWPPGRHDPPGGGLRMISRGHPTWTAILFRREVLDEIGYLDPDVGMCSDLEFELRIGLRLPFVLATRPCAFWVVHPGSRSSAAGLEEFWPGWPRMIAKIERDRSLPPAARERAAALLRAKLVRRLVRTSLVSAAGKRFDEARTAAAAIQELRGSAATGRLVKTFARAAGEVPALVTLAGALDGLRRFAARRRTARRLSGWGGLDEARRYLHLLQHDEARSGPRRRPDDAARTDAART